MNNNMSRLKDIATVLGDINDDKAAPTPQPSEDIDCVVEIATYGEWTDFEAKLRAKGFQDIDASGEDSNPPTCRKYFLGIKIDFMPVEETVLGYGNQWFKAGLENSIKVNLEEVEVNIFKIEYFVATKLKAFNDRGITGDIRFSQDLEDLTELIDGVTKIETEIMNSVETVKKFIIQELKKILDSKDEYKEAMYGFLGYDDADTREARIDRIFDIIQRICK